MLRDGDTVVLPIGAGEAPALLHALSDRRRDLRGVTVFQLLPLVQAGYFDPDTTEHVRHSTAFLGGTSRQVPAQGWVDYCPAHFSEIPELIRRGLLPCDVVFARASAMDEHGYFSLGLSADYTMAAIERARAVVLEVNPGVPFCFGDCHVHISQVTALVESSDPIVELPHPATRAGRAGHRTLRRRADPGRRDPADRHRRDPRCGGAAARGQERPRGAHRDVRRRDPRRCSRPGSSPTTARTCTTARCWPRSPSGRATSTSTCTATPRWRCIRWT